MPHLEPSYLRYIYDGLEKGELHPDNAAVLPEGLTGLYEAAFEESKTARERQVLLKTFAIWALLKKEVSAEFVAEILDVPTQEIVDFIATYSSWFTSPESGKYQLYHERLKVYLLQKLNEHNINLILSKLIKFLNKKNKTEEIWNYSKEWKGYYYLLCGNFKLGSVFLEKNIDNQNQNWWESTFELYCNCVFSSNYLITQKDFYFYSRLTNLNQCINASKLVAKKFNQIKWEEFSDFTHETRFHYTLADMLSNHFEEINENLVHNIILNEDHYLSYILAYAWKYNCWRKENVIHKELINKIKASGSPYLRILLRQIDGGRLLLKKEGILDASDYQDCWEYVSEDFIENIQIGKNTLLAKYLEDVELCSNLLENNLFFIIDEFDYLHIQIEKIHKIKIEIQKSPYFYKIIQILWEHPAWEIGEIGNELIKNKLKNAKNHSQIEEITNWILYLANDKPTYSISILLFDIIEVSDISEEYITLLIEKILDWKDAQIRGQFIASSINFFANNKDNKWFELIKKQFIKLCSLASDIWETQEIIELFNSLDERLTKNEINYYIENHKILNKIPKAFELDYNTFWKTAEKLRIKGIL